MSDQTRTIKTTEMGVVGVYMEAEMHAKTLEELATAQALIEEKEAEIEALREEHAHEHVRFMRLQAAVGADFWRWDTVEDPLKAHVELDHNRKAGMPVVAGTRIQTAFLAGMVMDGRGVESLEAFVDDLGAEPVLAALVFEYLNRSSAGDGPEGDWPKADTEEKEG